MSRADIHLASAPNVVVLDVGGTIFKTLKATLLRVEGSYFHALLGSGLWQPDGAGAAYFLDVDPAIFRHVLQVLRTGTVLSWDGLSKGDRHAFMTTMEYLNLNRVGVQSFEWSPFSYSSPTAMKLSNGSRTVESRCAETVVRSTSVLVGSCRVLVEYHQYGYNQNKFAIGVGPKEVANMSTNCYWYRNTGQVSAPRGGTAVKLPALGRGDVVTIRRGPSHVAFSLNDGEPVHIALMDASDELYPVVYMHEEGTKMTLLE